MKKFYSSITFMFMILVNVYGQFDATITITDELSTLPLENVDVFLDGQSGSTNASGEVTFSNLNDGTYQYSFTLDCYETGSESLTIAGSNTAESAVMTPSTSNNVFFFIGDPLTIPGATVSLFDSEGYFETLTTGNFLGDIIENVPFGEYNYTVELDCYETIFGSVTVECIGGGQGVVVAENPVEQTTNNVFFFIGEPLTIPGATVSLFDSEGYFETLTTGNFLGDIIENVPFGEYNYTVELDCYETIFGSVTVECLGGGQGVVVAENPQPQTTNNVFFFIGDPLTIPGATVSLFDSEGYFETIETGNFLGDIIENVPFGEYNYTVELDCYETVSGSVTVECLGGGQGVVVAENPQPQTTNSVFFFIGDPLTIPGATVSLFDSEGYFETIETGNFLGDIIENVPFGEYSYTVELDCYETVSGSVTVECLGGGQGVVVAENPQPQTTNSVFFFIGDPLTIPGATVSLFNDEGYFETLETGNFLGDIIENVPFGEYSYTVELECYESITGSVTVECLGGGQGVVVAENPQPQTTNNVFFFIGDPLTIPGATVSLFDSEGYFETIETGNFLGDIIENVPFGEYSYTVELDCYETVSGSVTVECLGGGQGVVVAENPQPQTTNSVFFFIGDPLTIPGATVSLFNDEGYFETLETGNFLGDIIENVPFGEYSYTVELECYESITGSVTVECLGGGQGVVVAENPQPQTTNNVFFFIGDPLTIPGATVSLFDSEGYFETIETGNFLGDIIENVPFGEYGYTVELDCYETVSGSVTVECLGGGQGIVVAENPQPQTTNSVFFFIGDPLTIPGATVSLFNDEGYFETLETGNFLGDIIENVPFGEYSYTVELECYETISGSVTVECLGGGQGVVVAENPSEIILDNTVTQSDNVLVANAAGLTYQWVDCDNGNAEIEGETDQTFIAEVDGNYAVIVSTENCSSTSDCISVIVSGIFDKKPSLEALVYPNPFAGNLNIQMETTGSKTSVEIMSITGKVLRKENFIGTEFMTLDLSGLASGAYVLRVINEDRQYSSPIIKQ